jgi:uncharacterized protein DUF4244
MSRARQSSRRVHAALTSRLINAATAAVSAVRFVIEARLHTAAEVGTPTVGTPTVGMSTADMSTAGMSTAEYAIGTVAACAFAALLYKVVTSTQILDLLTGVVSRALHVPF